MFGQFSLTHIQKSSENLFKQQSKSSQRKQVVMLLRQSAAALIPIPLVQEAIGVALMIIEVSEVREIVHGLMLVCCQGQCKIGYAI